VTHAVLAVIPFRTNCQFKQQTRFQLRKVFQANICRLFFWFNYFRCIEGPSSRRDSDIGRRWDGKCHCVDRYTVGRRRCPKYLADRVPNNRLPSIREDIGIDLTNKNRFSIFIYKRVREYENWPVTWWHSAPFLHRLHFCWHPSPYVPDKQRV